MSLVRSLLNAILRLDGEALVMHVGEKPYVVSPTGQVELASRPLNFDAVSGMVSQLLPAELQRALDEFGAVQFEFPKSPEFSGEHFTVVAARGGDDVWVEIRRRRVPDDDYVPEDFFPPRQNAPVDPAAEPLHHRLAIETTVIPRLAIAAVAESSEHRDLVTDPAVPDPLPVTSEPAAPFIAEPASVLDAPEPFATFLDATPEVDRAPQPTVEYQPLASTVEPVRPHAPVVAEAILDKTIVEPPFARSVSASAEDVDFELPLAAPRPDAPTRDATSQPDAARKSATARVDESASVAPEPPPVVRMAQTGGEAPRVAERSDDPPPLALVTGFVRPVAVQPAMVVPIARRGIHPELPSPAAASTASGLDRLLRLAAARTASTLYLTSAAPPSIRVDREIQSLSGEAALSPGEVESMLIDLMPERNREELRRGIATEWICDVAGVGRVRCLTFRDHRGAGGIFRMMPVQAISADQLGLSREIQALAAEPEGLVLVTGPRTSGKSTLVSAFVDLINRTRRDHVITIESEIKVVHEQRHSLVSQREVRGNAEEMLSVARAAIRENPDVLVIEDLRSADMVSIALEAAGSGHLVLGALPAHTATAAVDRIIDLYPPEQRRHVQLSLAETLRGIVAQVLVRKPAGGRAAAREVLLNTPAVASVIAEGKTSQLPLAMEGGRKYGMVPLNDALVGLVQTGTVDAREAYRRAADRAAFLTVLKRYGLDTSFVERLA